MKRILLIGGNYWPELTGIGKYNGEMMDWLATHGYDCSVLTTYPYYPQWAVQSPYLTKAWRYSGELGGNGKMVKVIRCPHYIPKNPTGVRRLLSEVSIFCSFFFPFLLLLTKRKYNVVMVVAPSFMLGFFGMMYKFLRGTRFIYHIQDLQIDAAKHLGMIKSPRIIRILEKVEKQILNSASLVCSISDGMRSRIHEKCFKEIVSFPNWVDLQIFYPVTLTEELRQKFGFSLTDKIVLYSGAIGEKQGLDLILQAATSFKKCSKIKFVICGTGPYRKYLEADVHAYGLENVHFLPLQPVDRFNEFLNIADIHLVLQKASASDLLLPSKLSAIFAVGGVSVVTASERTSLYNIVKQSESGILAEPDSAPELITAIQCALDSNVFEMKKNARNYALEHLSVDSILQRFEKAALMN